MARDAESLYESFRGRKHERETGIGIKFGRRWLTAPGGSNILIPESLAVVGHVAAIEYDTTRDHRTVLARHEFAKGARPLLAVGAHRGQLFLVGDRYRFTDRGIIDIDNAGREIEGGLVR